MTSTFKKFLHSVLADKPSLPPRPDNIDNEDIYETAEDDTATGTPPPLPPSQVWWITITSSHRILH